eukprot:UN22463
MILLILIKLSHGTLEEDYADLEGLAFSEGFKLDMSSPADVTKSRWKLLLSCTMAVHGW